MTGSGRPDTEHFPKVKRILLTAGAVLAITTCARAQEPAPSLKFPTAIYLASASADIATTVYCQSAGCREDNPMVNWLEPRGTTVMLAAGEAADIAGLWAWNRFVGRRNPKLAKIALYVVSGVRFAIAARNIREGREQRRLNAAAH
jgi:hypothetical protein